METRRIKCGYSIEAQPGRGHEPALVRLFKMGGTETTYLTPDEADGLSEALLEAANDARRKL